MFRLIALESASVSFPAVYYPPPAAVKKRRKSLRFFLLGVACAIVFGGIALAILLIAAPEPARAETLMRAGSLMREVITRVDDATHFVIGTAAASSSDHLVVEGRQLWWKLPLESRLQNS
jgi:hypothetical protein